MQRINAAVVTATLFVEKEDEALNQAIRCFELEQWSDAIKHAARVRGIFIPIGTLVSRGAAEMMQEQEQERESSKVEVMKK